MREVLKKPVEEQTDQQELTATAQIAIARTLVAARVLNAGEITS